MKIAKWSLNIVAGATLVTFTVLSACSNDPNPNGTSPSGPTPSSNTSQPSSSPAPVGNDVRQTDPRQRFDVAAQFVASGWMGDGEVAGAKFVQLDEGWKGNPHSPPVCIRVRYTPGPHGWGGIYWQNKADNWGDKPGEDFGRAGYRRVTFWARGETGGELVEFKAGGINATGKRFRDSFEATAGKIALDRDWKQYAIGLEGKDLSSVIGGFCCVASKTANERGITFYLDDIYYEP